MGLAIETSTPLTFFLEQPFGELAEWVAVLRELTKR